MLIIRQQQMETFRESALAAFETEMVVHCSGFSPRLCEVIGEEQLRVAIRQTIGRARFYGFTNRGPVCLFIEMMLLFGSAFDTDPQYPWAAEILKSHELDFQMQRARHLYKKTLDYLKKVVGPEDMFTLQALKPISALAQLPLPVSRENFISDMMREIAYVYPEKAAYVGNDALEQMIREGINEATAHGMATTHSMAIFCVLMFAFGHGCTDDPLYPWIARTLKDEKITGPATRTERLQKKAMTWLDRNFSISSGYFRKNSPQSSFQKGKM